MDAMAQSAVTVREHLLWLDITLNHTDKLAAAVPENLLDWRPADPSGKFSFSLAEIIMHVADARLMFSATLTGEEVAKDYWTTSETGPGDDGVWPFREYGSKQALLDSLKTARAKYDAFIDQPYTALFDVPEGAKQAFEQQLKAMREYEIDTAGAEKRGPANVLRVLMGLVAHEAGHRGSLLTLLRQHGVNLEE